MKKEYGYRPVCDSLSLPYGSNEVIKEDRGEAIKRSSFNLHASESLVHTLISISGLLDVAFEDSIGEEK